MSMNQIDWNTVNYIESEQKLICVGQTVDKLPDVLINLYHNRVRYLDLSFNELTSLNGINLFLNLEELILDNNQLDDNIIFPKYLKSLKILSINNNKINNLNLLLLRLSSCVPDLEYLSLLGNPACPDQLSYNICEFDDYQNYRYQVINTLTKLKFLDSKPITNIERHQSINKENNIILNILNEKKFYFNPKLLWQKFQKNTNYLYNPLPSTIRLAGEHKGAYGKQIFKYIGTQSEGNRFISNKDL